MFCIDLQWMIIFIQFNIVTEAHQVKKNELKLIIIFLCIYQLYLLPTMYCRIFYVVFVQCRAQGSNEINIV